MKQIILPKPGIVTAYLNIPRKLKLWLHKSAGGMVYGESSDVGTGEGRGWDWILIPYNAPRKRSRVGLWLYYPATDAPLILRRRPRPSPSEESIEIELILCHLAVVFGRFQPSSANLNFRQRLTVVSTWVVCTFVWQTFLAWFRCLNFQGLALHAGLPKLLANYPLRNRWSFFVYNWKLPA